MSDGLVQLVDLAGRTIGRVPKLEAHQGEGRLHRAISVLLFRRDGRVLLQRRSPRKYHFRGVWANSCCTHPYGAESPRQAAERALRHELGIRCPIHQVGTFRYRALDSRTGLVEHEYDHVFRGDWDREVRPREDEIEVVEWMTSNEVIELLKEPRSVAPWLAPVYRVANALGSS
ncbi:MAG: isopentenyl-diphosphate Delta-isomerase [Fimbriimonadaceae bacterium]|nr:isopentenyl-diphosphate Delta-isomerase [Fimbriimonadaceae bacterium]